MRKKFIIISVCFLLLFFSACQEKTEREWYCKEANVKLKICVNDSCDVFIINDYDSIFTEHNRIYYQDYYLHFLNNTDSLFFMDRENRVLKVKQNKYIISVCETDTVNYIFDPENILDKKGITIQGSENGRFILFINKKYQGEIPLVSMK